MERDSRNARGGRTRSLKKRPPFDELQDTQHATKLSKLCAVDELSTDLGTTWSTLLAIRPQYVHSLLAALSTSNRLRFHSPLPKYLSDIN